MTKRYRLRTNDGDVVIVENPDKSDGRDFVYEFVSLWEAEQILAWLHESQSPEIMAEKGVRITREDASALWN